MTLEFELASILVMKKRAYLSFVTNHQVQPHNARQIAKPDLTLLSASYLENKTLGS